MIVLSTLDPTSSYWLVLGGILPVGVGMALPWRPRRRTSWPRFRTQAGSGVRDQRRCPRGRRDARDRRARQHPQRPVPLGCRRGRAESAPAGLVNAAQESLGAALGIAGRLGDRGAGLATGARHAFVSGMGDALLVSAGALVVVMLILLVAIPGKKSSESQAPEDEAAEQPELEGAGDENRTRTVSLGS